MLSTITDRLHDLCEYCSLKNFGIFIFYYLNSDVFHLISVGAVLKVTECLLISMNIMS